MAPRCLFVIQGLTESTAVHQTADSPLPYVRPGGQCCKISEVRYWQGLAIVSLSAGETPAVSGEPSLHTVLPARLDLATRRSPTHAEAGRDRRRLAGCGSVRAGECGFSLPALVYMSAFHRVARWVGVVKKCYEFGKPPDQQVGSTHAGFIARRELSFAGPCKVASQRLDHLAHVRIAFSQGWPCRGRRG